MRILFGVAALAFVTACASAPETTSASLVSGAPNAEKASDDKICRRVPVTGSNMAKKVCSTAEEWAAYDAKGREGVDQFDRERDNAGGGAAGERLQ